MDNRKSIILGTSFITLSLLIFTYDASMYNIMANVATHSNLLFTFPESLFLIAIVLMAIGVSFFKVSIVSFVRSLYKNNIEDLDSGFSIFYMFLNTGALFVPITLNFVVGVHNPSLYQYGFLIAFLSMLVGLILFLILKKKYLTLPNGEAIGVVPVAKEKKIEEEKNNLSIKLTKVEITNLKIISLVLICTIINVICSEQIFSSLIIFAEAHINNLVPIVNIELAPYAFLTLNPLFIIVLSPVYIKLFDFIAGIYKELSSITKMGIGLLILSAAYLTLFIASSLSSNINMLWMVAFYFFAASAELFIVPVTLSLISKLAPQKYTSLIFGIYYGVFGISAMIAGLFAAALPINGPTSLFNIIPVPNFPSFFMIFVVLALAIGIVWLLLGNKLKKLSTDI